MRAIRVFKRSAYTMPATIDTDRVSRYFPKRDLVKPEQVAQGSKDPKNFYNRTSAAAGRKKKTAGSNNGPLLPAKLPTSHAELSALLVEIKEARKTRALPPREYDVAEKIVRAHLDWEVPSALPRYFAAHQNHVEEMTEDEIFEEEDMTALARLRRDFLKMGTRRASRRWDDLVDIQRDELREMKRLALKRAQLEREMDPELFAAGLLSLSSTQAEDRVSVLGADQTTERTLDEIFGKAAAATATAEGGSGARRSLSEEAGSFENQFPYHPSTASAAAGAAAKASNASFAGEKQRATQALDVRAARQTQTHRLVPKESTLHEHEEMWSNSSSQDAFVFHQRIQSYLDEVQALQRSIESKRRTPVLQHNGARSTDFWLEKVSDRGFAKLGEIYDAYFEAPLGEDGAEEEALLSLLKRLERAGIVQYSSLVRESDFVSELCVGETASADPMEQGKYLTIGHWIFDREVPRSFEKYEWSPRMLRLPHGTDLDAYPADQAEDYAFQIEQFLDIREKMILGNRWDLKYARPPLVRYDKRQIMLRAPGMQLCRELEMASQTETAICKLLVGARGVGKSAVLLHTVAWARENGWITLVLPRAASLVTSRGAFESGTEEYGVNVMPPDSTIDPTWFGQPRGAEEVLERVKLAHLQQLSTLPQQRKYAHKLYDAPGGAQGTLAHILMRGLRNLSKASDALYDLRMELNLQTKLPVLIAVDEFDALYWPTAVWYNNAPVPAHKLTICKAFRFINSVPGDVEDDGNARTVRQAKLNREHLPRRGGIIAATTRSLEAEPHESQIPPCRFDAFPIQGVDKVEIPKYTAREVEKAVAWYQKRHLYDEGEVDETELGRIRALTGGFADKVAIYSQNRNIHYPGHL